MTEPESRYYQPGGIPRGPIGVTRFIKNAALAEADRLAAERDQFVQTD